MLGCLGRNEWACYRDTETTRTYISMKKLLYSEATRVLTNIDETIKKDIYAISFFFDFYDDPFTVIRIGYNTKEQLKKMTPVASSAREAKWNYAFWLQEDIFIFGEKGTPSFDIIQREKALEAESCKQSDKGDGDEYSKYDNCDEYAQYKVDEKISVCAVEVAAELAQSNFIAEIFGSRIPIIVHELLYDDKTIKMTKLANPHNESAEFIEFVESGCQ